MAMDDFRQFGRFHIEHQNASVGSHDQPTIISAEYRRGRHGILIAQGNLARSQRIVIDVAPFQHLVIGANPGAPSTAGAQADRMQSLAIGLLPLRDRLTATYLPNQGPAVSSNRRHARSVIRDRSEYGAPAMSRKLLYDFFGVGIGDLKLPRVERDRDSRSILSLGQRGRQPRAIATNGEGSLLGSRRPLAIDELPNEPAA